MKKTEIKKVAILTAVFTGIIVLMVLLSSCSNSNEADPAENVMFKLEEVWSNKNDSIGIYRDVTTNIVYLRDNVAQRGGYTVIPNPETGLPLTYDRFLEIYTVKEG